jgi:hypothetical protein
MKKKMIILALAALAVLLAGCCLSAAEGASPRQLPLISIQTADPARGLEFVTEPVTRFVAEDISTWTPDYVIPIEPYYVDCAVSYTGRDGTAGVDGAAAQVKVRGNWTTMYEKKPLRIKFGEKQSMGSLNGGQQFKNWVLLASYKDLSILRDKAAFDLARKIMREDLYCSDCELVEVEINGEYWGVYLLAEQQECSKGRVNIPEPKKDETSPDTGYLVEFDGYYYLEDSLHSFTIDYAGFSPLIPFDGTGNATPFTPLSTDPGNGNNVGYTIKSNIRSNEQYDTVRSFFAGAYEIMYASAYRNEALEMTEDYRNTVPSEKTPREAVEAVVDVESLAEAYILSEIACDPDIYWSSFYMTLDLSESGSRKLRFEAPWDFDSAMGNRDVIEDGTGFHAANVVDDVNHVFQAINPWLTVLFQADWFRDMVTARWTELYDSGAFSDTVRMIREDSVTYQDAFTRNYQRWSNMDDKAPLDYELNREAFACRNEAESAEQLAHWLERRIEFLNGVWHK